MTKNQKVVVIVLSILIIILLGLFIFYFISQNPTSQLKSPPLLEDITKKQMEELYALRGQAGYKSLTEEEIKNQMLEINNLRANTNTLTQNEINKQMEDLNKLRSQ